MADMMKRMAGMGMRERDARSAAIATGGFSIPAHCSRSKKRGPASGSRPTRRTNLRKQREKEMRRRKTGRQARAVATTIATPARTAILRRFNAEHARAPADIPRVKQRFNPNRKSREPGTGRSTSQPTS